MILSYSRKQTQSLYLILWIPSARLLARADNEVAINLALSIHFILYDILSIASLSTFVTSFSIGTEKIFGVIVLNCALFSPRHSSSLLILL